MQVGAGGIPRAPHFADQGAGLHPSALLGEDDAEVAVNRGETLGLVNSDVVPQNRTVPGSRHDAVAGRKHGRPVVCGDIHPGVSAFQTRERVIPFSEIGADTPALGGPEKILPEHQTGFHRVNLGPGKEHLSPDAFNRFRNLVGQTDGGREDLVGGG